MAHPVALVREIVEPPVLAALPNALDHVLGVAIWGETVMIFDLRALLGRPAREEDPETRVLLLNVPCEGVERTMGQRVDRVLEVAESVAPLAKRRNPSSRMTAWSKAGCCRRTAFSSFSGSRGSSIPRSGTP